MSAGMSPDDPLTELAKAAGVATRWTDASGKPRYVSADTLRAVLRAMHLPADTPAQTHDSLSGLRELVITPPTLAVVTAGSRLRIPGMRHRCYRIQYENGTHAEGRTTRDGDGLSVPVPDCPGYHSLELDGYSCLLAVAPSHCPTPNQLLRQDPPRAWGIAAQIYSLRHTDPLRHPAAGGYGDFGALGELAGDAARLGADALAISPVHAMFSAEPGACSPYSPSSRLFLNVLYADPGAVFSADEVRAAMAAVDGDGRAAALERTALIDWQAAGTLRLALLRKLYDGFDRAAPAPREAYARFRQAGGDALQNHAVFEVLHGRHTTDWRKWPYALRDPRSSRTRGFGAAHEHEVGFHIFAQWLARTSLERAQADAHDAGMRIGLIADLAVGTDPRGSHAWGQQADIIEGLSIGAPPDLHNPAGQQWGLAAFSPYALRERGYGPFIDMLRAVLAGTGGIRIDHILGLARLWVVPPGATPAAGAYLRYPLDDMLRLIALEAWRHQSLVVGENLGTVPAGLNDQLAQHGILGTSVLWFQTEPLSAGSSSDSHPAFLPPHRWPSNTIAMPNTHDLPTLRGWWEGRDLYWRQRLYGEPDSARAERLCQARRTALWSSLRAAGLARANDPPRDPPIADVLSFVAATAAPLMLAPLEDLAAIAEQPNLPGTVARHPNWRQRLPTMPHGLLHDPALRARIEAIKAVRSTS